MSGGAARVTVAVPVWNGERYIAEAIESVLSQTFGDFELLIADNASTDRTLEICRGYAERDARVRILTSDENRGAAWNFNRVVDEASAALFKWASSDDLLAPEMLERCVTILDADPDVVLAYSNALMIDEHGETIGRYDVIPDGELEPGSARFREMVLVNHMCIAVFGVMRTEALLRTPRIGPYVGSDRVLLAELSLRGKIRHTEEWLMSRRDHPDCSMRAHRDVRKRLEWFNTRARGAHGLPNWRRLAEYHRAVCRGGATAGERFRARLTLLRWMVREWRGLSRDVRNRLLTALLGAERAR